TNWPVSVLGLGSFSDAKFANGLFVVLAWGLHAFLTSSDGVLWQYNEAPDSRYFQSVGYANGRFGALSGAASDGSQPALSAVSFDGLNWSGVPLTDSFTNSTKLVATGDKFFLLNTVSNGFFSSSDALTWQPRSFGTNVQITDVAFGNNTFV